MRKVKEKGAIVVEATISLTAFVFAIFTILSLVNIYYIQARMSVALNSAAKEISQYSYLYYALDLVELDKKVSEGTEDSKAVATQTIDGVGTLLNSFSNIEKEVESVNVDTETADFDQMMAEINGTVENVTTEVETMATTADSLITMYADKLSEDPKGFILGMGKMAASELKEEAKALLGQVLAKSFMKKNLKAYAGDDPDAFLKRYRVVNGMAGLDFDYTTLMAYGTSNQIQLCVTYDVSVIKLLNIDYKFTFRQVAKTAAWGNGISIIDPSRNELEFTESTEEKEESVWDDPIDTNRGKKLVALEKKNYTYTSNRNGYHAYNNAGGANEFVKIMSLDTAAKSYQTANEIKNQINIKCNELKNGVSALGEKIVVKNKYGNDVSLTSNKDTRTYKIVLIIPDDSDMTIVNQAVNEFKSQNHGVKVEINKNYGTHTPKAETENEKNVSEGES